MKITEKHRIKYKRKDSPSKPLEMAIFRDDEGDYLTTTGDIVAYDDGTPSWWVENMLDGTSNLFVGEIIPPPLEPKLGMVVCSPEDRNYYFMCFSVDPEVIYNWVASFGNTYKSDAVEKLIKDFGWEVVSCGN